MNTVSRSPTDARTLVSVGLVSIAVLTFELGLVRLFDFVLDPSYGYTVLTCALFAMGIAGLAGAVRPLSPTPVTGFSLLLGIAISIGASSLLLDAIPFDIATLLQNPLSQLGWFAAVLAVVAAPFYLFGRYLIAVFADAPARIGTLYSVNLIGSAAGCVAILPLMPALGPGRSSVLCGALAVVAAAVQVTNRTVRWFAWILALAVAAVPFALDAERFEVRAFIDKHGVRHFQDRGEIALTRWDPVSRIDVIPIVGKDRGVGAERELFKHVAYDGGSQTTRFNPFDGDVAALRRRLGQDPGLSSDYFWQKGLLAPHHLKRDTGARVLAIGAGGGQDVLAALVHGAARIDAVEMVGTVIELAKNEYGEFIGHLYSHPSVRTFVAEGRAFLRGTDESYDIIQVFSNHTTSTMAAGTGAFNPEYLQTVEAYREFFEHLSRDGILHVSHHAYPRMVTTAATAWKESGRTAFRRHVVVFERDLPTDLLPTFLVKMSPWTAAEITDLEGLFTNLGWREDYRYRLVENPLDEAASFLSPDFFAGDPAVSEGRDYRVSPCTDDRPYFNFLRLRARELRAGDDRYLDRTTREYLNSRLVGGWLPSELFHLMLPAAVGLCTLLLAWIVSRLVPGVRARSGRRASLVFFGCIGFGFITVELTLVQLCIRPIGVPLHAYSLVIFAVLIGAGLGSYLVQRFSLGAGRRWLLAFGGILAAVTAFLLGHESFFADVLGWPLWARLIGVAGLVFPIGVFLGMPFPLGVLALRDGDRASIAWAFGVNAICTILGGVVATAATMMFGFRAVLCGSLLVYLAGGLALRSLRRS